MELHERIRAPDRSPGPAAAPAPRRPAPDSRAGRWLARCALLLAGRPGRPALLSWLVLVGIALAVAYPNLPEIGGLTDYRPKLPMRVYSADGVLIGEFGEERRSFMPIGRDPEGDAGRGAGRRGRPLLRARRRRLQGHAARRAGQLRRPRQPGRIDDHDAGGAQLLPVDREDLHPQDLRDPARAEDREPADQGPDPRGLHEPDLPGPARLRLRLGRARSTSASR